MFYDLTDPFLGGDFDTRYYGQRVTHSALVILDADLMVAFACLSMYIPTMGTSAPDRFVLAIAGLDALLIAVCSSLLIRRGLRARREYGRGNLLTHTVLLTAFALGLAAWAAVLWF